MQINETQATQKKSAWRWLKRGILILFALVLILPALLYAAFAVISSLSRPADPQAAKKLGDKLLTLHNKIIVVVSAHPDDVDYWASGTLARLHRNGNKIIMVLGTSGEKGADIPNLGKIREGQQLKAAKIVGYDKVIFLRHPDRGLKSDSEFKSELRSIFKQYQPDLLFTFDIEKEAVIYRHSDHEAAGTAAHAVAPAFESIKDIYQFHTSAPNVIVDVTSVADVKSRAMEAHAYRQEQNNGLIGLLGFFFRLFGRGDRRRFGADNSFEKSLGVKYAEVLRVVPNRQ